MQANVFEGWFYVQFVLYQSKLKIFLLNNKIDNKEETNCQTIWKIIKVVLSYTQNEQMIT